MLISNLPGKTLKGDAIATVMRSDQSNVAVIPCHDTTCGILSTVSLQSDEESYSLLASASFYITCMIFPLYLFATVMLI